MANQNGTFANLSSLMTSLSTFAQSNGYTEDHAASDRLFLTNGRVSVAFRWATVSPTYVAMYQHESYNGIPGDNPGLHNGDSGTGENSSTSSVLDNAKGFNVSDVRGGQFWFYTDGDYIHAVITYDTEWYEHFGFGTLDKVGTWTGGEYSYGQYRNGISTAGILDADGLTFTWLLDGAYTASSVNPQKYAATVRAEGLPGQDITGRWILMGGNAGQSVFTNDRAGNPRYFANGGFRGGPDANALARFESSNATGFNPMYPIKCWWKDQTPKNEYYHIGSMKDVRGINMRFFKGGDEITVGAETWVVFPARYTYSDGVAAGRPSASTGNLGIAYRKF